MPIYEVGPTYDFVEWLDPRIYLESKVIYSLTSSMSILVMLPQVIAFLAHALVGLTWFNICIYPHTCAWS